MDRKHLLRQLDIAISKAATIAINNNYHVTDKKAGVWIGKAYVRKNKDGLYDILSLNKKTLFTDITVFDVATIVAERYTAGEFRTIEKILILENVFSKYYNDMVHYLHCIKGAKKRNDYTTLAILEDKFQISEARAKMTRNDITHFKRVK